MPEKETQERRNHERGARKGQRPTKEDQRVQRDPEESAPHMPRHWQGPGTRGEAPGQATPGPDQREVARGNQYGRAGRLASEQVHEELTEHGQETTPQRRDNKQLPKRPGERESDLPTPAKPMKKK